MIPLMEVPSINSKIESTTVVARGRGVKDKHSQTIVNVV